MVLNYFKDDELRIWPGREFHIDESETKKKLDINCSKAAMKQNYDVMYKY